MAKKGSVKATLDRPPTRILIGAKRGNRTRWYVRAGAASCAFRVHGFTESRCGPEPKNDDLCRNRSWQTIIPAAPEHRGHLSPVGELFPLDRIPLIRMAKVKRPTCVGRPVHLVSLWSLQYGRDQLLYQFGRQLCGNPL